MSEQLTLWKEETPYDHYTFSHFSMKPNLTGISVLAL